MIRYAVSLANFIETWRFKVAKDIGRSDVVLFDNVEERFYSPEALAARLYGLRVADVDWVSSRMKGGVCLSFEISLQQHRHIRMSDVSFPVSGARLNSSSSCRQLSFQTWIVFVLIKLSCISACERWQLA